LAQEVFGDQFDNPTDLAARGAPAIFAMKLKQPGMITPEGYSDLLGNALDHLIADQHIADSHHEVPQNTVIQSASLNGYDNSFNLPTMSGSLIEPISFYMDTNNNPVRIPAITQFTYAQVAKTDGSQHNVPLEQIGEYENYGGIGSAYVLNQHYTDGPLEGNDTVIMSNMTQATLPNGEIIQDVFTYNLTMK
jgi:hypothetical protein